MSDVNEVGELLDPDPYGDQQAATLLPDPPTTPSGWPDLWDELASEPDPFRAELSADEWPTVHQIAATRGTRT